MTALNPAFVSPTSRPLPFGFGYVLGTGDRILSTVTAPSSTSAGGALYGIYILCEGECDGMEMFAPQQPAHLENSQAGLTKAQYYAGITQVLHFHAGRYTIKGAGNQLFSIGDDQQYDSFFSNFPSVAPPQSYSGMAYYILGIAPTATKLGVGTPFPLAPIGIWRLLRCRIFDANGNVTAYGFTTNPAWHWTEAILRFKIKPQQPALAGLTNAERACFNWPSIVATAQRNDFILPNGRPRFVGNYVFAAGTTLTNILETILRVSRSYQRLEGSKLALYGDDPRASVFLMGANNVVPGSLKLGKKDLSKAPNVFVPKYRDIDIPAIARVIRAQRVVPSFAPIPQIVFTLGSLSPFQAGDILQYGGALDPTFDGAYAVVAPFVSVHGSLGGVTDLPNQVRCSTTSAGFLIPGSGGGPPIPPAPPPPLTSTTGGFVGTNDARFSERAPTNVVHRSAQKLVAAQAPGLPAQPRIVPVEYDMGNSTFDQTNRIMKFERDRLLGTDTERPVLPVVTAPALPPPFPVPAGSGVAWAYPLVGDANASFGDGTFGIFSDCTGGASQWTAFEGSPAGGIADYFISTSFGQTSIVMEWGNFALGPGALPPDARITGIYPVTIAGCIKTIAGHDITYNAGSVLGFFPIPDNGFNPSEFFGATIGTSLAALAGATIKAHLFTSIRQKDVSDALECSGVGFAVYYESATPTIPTTVPLASASPSIPWKAPITGALTGYFEAIDINGNPLVDVKEHDVITLDDWVTSEFTGDYEVMERKITAPPGDSLGEIVLQLHQYNRNAYTDVSDDPGGSYATVPSTDLPFGTFPVTNPAWVLQATPLAILDAGTGKLTVKTPDLSIQLMGRIAPTLYPNASWTGLVAGNPYVLYVDDPLGTGVGATFGSQAGKLPLTANPVGRYVVLSGVFNPNNFVNIDLQVGTATFFCGSGADSTNFLFPSTPGSDRSNLIAWSSPRGHIDAGSNHLHYISASQIDPSGLLHLQYNDSVGDQWAGPSNYAGITWSEGASAVYSTIGVMQFVELTLAGGEQILFGQGNLNAGAPIVFPAGYSLAKSILLAFPFSNADSGQPTLGLQAYVDATGHAFFKMENGGTHWQGQTQPFICAWKNNSVPTSGYVKIPMLRKKALYLGGFSILDSRRGGIAPPNFPTDNLTHVLSGGKLPLPGGISTTTLQVMPGPNSFDASNTGNPAHGVNECLVDGSQNVKTSFSDGGNVHVWYGSSAVFALLYE